MLRLALLVFIVLGLEACASDTQGPARQAYFTNTSQVKTKWQETEAHPTMYYGCGIFTYPCEPLTYLPPLKRS